MREISVSSAIEIAKKYGYKCKLNQIGTGRAYLSFSEPFYKSTFPSYYYTRTVSKKYAELMFNIYSN